MANEKEKNNTGVFNLPAAEEKILDFWKKNHIFEKTLEKSQESRVKSRKFVFYEGPPYANGKPGIHHVLARIYKDIILRYKTMRGYYVPRKAGWDTHGLPVEMAAEKALGLKSKKDIEKFGIKRFNEEAKKAVWLYKDEWEKLTERIGYWLDLKNAYVTYEPEYIESIWWSISQIAKKGLLYKGHKVVPWCTRCGTALSSHELALGYKEVKDNSVYVKFKLKSNQNIGNYKSGKNSYILSWTTTPWTLPGNVALAVGKNIQYVATEERLGGDELWYAADSAIAKEFGRTDKKTRGSDLVGLEYEPLFDVKPLHSKNSYKIYDADFVSTSEGTGVVHTAVMYGEDDYKLGQKVGLPQHHTVDEEGKFTGDTRELVGAYVKSSETEKKIIDHLEKNNNLLKTEQYVHEYPHCWRCETPVLYYARNSWFIAMSKLRAKLLAANKTINWVPEHLKNGRFGEWLREVKDWNLSRERYWGAPLPIWECAKCGTHEVIGSLEELNERSGGAKNRYWTMRHGESLANVMRVIDDARKGKMHLTDKGKLQAKKSAGAFKKQLDKKREKIDLILYSDIIRTRETAKFAVDILDAKETMADKRLEEIHLGTIEGCHDGRYHELYPTYESKFEQRPEGGESLRDLRRRVWEFLEDCEKKYNGKNILLVSHEYTIWMLNHMAEGWSEKQAIEEKIERGKVFVKTGEICELNLKITPRNDSGEIDLHRPFTDEIKINCKKCKGEMIRVKEVADVWYDSGAMPFAQAHYPFELAPQTDAERTQTGAENVPRKSASSQRSSASQLAYPADYIAEGMDQTRGWFYTLLAIATALGKEPPYKNVVSLGLINDKHGQKMSKSKGNTVEPWEVIKKYGVDAVRWYFFTVNPPGETKNFDEIEVVKAYRRFHALIWNSFVFLKTYAGKQAANGKRLASLEQRRSGSVTSKNVLDKWIFTRLDAAKEKVSDALDKFNVRDAALELEYLVDDLSRWYIRRSRRRLQKPENKLDYDSAVFTLRSVLMEITKLSAPFVPFFADELYKQLGGVEMSVHLEEWPKKASSVKGQTPRVIAEMVEVRRLASVVLAKRAEAGIKVRQPLARLKISARGRSSSGGKNKKSKISKELLEILKDEINVKEIIFDKKIKDEIELDIKITPELREEGILRELVRMVQGLRQEAKLRPQDKITLMLDLPEAIHNTVSRNEKLFKAEVGAKDVEYKKSEKFDAETVTKFEGLDIWLAVRKIK